MSEEKAIVRVVQEPESVEAKFSDHERLSLMAYRGSIVGFETQFAPALQAQLYELFLAGTSCEEIAKLNPGISLGQVLETRLRYGWDEKRDRYIEDLMVHAKERVQQMQLESLEHLRTSLAVAHKAFNTKAKKFLQTGSLRDLPDYSSVGMSWKQYKETLDLVLKLTGQEPPEKHEVGGTVTHVHTSSDASPPISTGLTPQTAALALRAFEDKKKLP